MIKSGRRNERDDRAPWGHVNKDSLLYSLPFFLALSLCIYTPPSLPLMIAGAARSLLHSLAFSLSCPPLPCLLPSSCPPQLLPFMFPPSFQFAPILPSSIPPLNPQATDQPSARREKKRKARGRVGVRKGERVVKETWECPLVKLDEGATETRRPAEMSKQTERESRGGFSGRAQSLQDQLKKKKKPSVVAYVETTTDHFAQISNTAHTSSKGVKIDCARLDGNSTDKYLSIIN